MSTGEQGDADDRSDMQRLASGDDGALNKIMERHGARLFQYFIRELRNECDAADLAEELFVRVYQHRQRFNPERRFSPWLYAIATNLVRDRLRWRARHPESSLEAGVERGGTDLDGRLPDPALTPEESLERAERAAAIRQAVSELPEELKTPLLLAEYEGLAHGEIAEILGCTSKAVELRIYRARQQLRERLAAWLKIN